MLSGVPSELFIAVVSKKAYEKNKEKTAIRIRNALKSTPRPTQRQADARSPYKHPKLRRVSPDIWAL